MTLYRDDPRNTVTATVSTSTDGLSAAVDIGGYLPAGLVMPSSWTAAAVTFQGGASSGGTFYDIYNSTGGEIQVSTTTGSYLSTLTLEESLRAGVYRYLKLRSGTTTGPIAQGSARSVTVVLRPFP